MIRTTSFLLWCLLLAPLLATVCLAQPQPLPNRWLFVWRDMSNPAQVDRTVALFPRARPRAIA